MYFCGVGPMGARPGKPHKKGAIMKTVSMDGRLFARMVEGGASRLYDRRTTVNDLNVFPIPDGDTGDNMFMTIEAGCRAAESSPEAGLGAAAKRIAGGMLMGARGNSGVILSRIFAGISEGLEGLSAADACAFARAMERGVSEAYRAVQAPVEGTILTVIADAVRFANSRLTEGTDFEAYFEDLGEELKASLERTPELLAVLAEAGVVDSGGAGLVYIAEGMQAALLNAELKARGTIGKASSNTIDISSFTEDSPFEFGYCTELLLRLRTEKTGPVEDFDEGPLFAALDKMGESMAAFRDGSVIKVHIHTMKPEEVLSLLHRYGEFLTLKIENMCLQHSEAKGAAGYEPKKPRKKFGIVAVAAGDGIKKTFLELGADEIVDGGQSMNPSAESFLEAFRRVNAERLLVFPNNSNVIMAAKQAAALEGSGRVRVIESRSVGDCYAALSMLDLSSGDPDEIERGALEIMASVKTGAVSRASRTTERDGVSIREGEFIGFSDGKVLTASETAGEALFGLAKALGAGDYGIMLLVSGCEAELSESREAAEKLQKEFPLVEVIPLDGGQPVFDYLIILE